MKHFLDKKRLTIFGAGGGGGGGGSAPPPPPPPVITQYPGVLAPPQIGQLNTLASFSYAEMIDLLSDGPIEGLVNKYGEKVYDENIFEGIYFNDTPIKESTQTARKISFSLAGFTSFLKTHFNYANGESLLEKNNPRVSVLSAAINNKINQSTNATHSIGAGAKITSYHPDDSIEAFINQRQGNVASLNLIKKAFDKVPVSSEKPFLTTIEFPLLQVGFFGDLFDRNDGGSTQSTPIVASMNNLSEHIYFTVSSDNLTSFNYFELPRTFITNDVETAAGKKTFSRSDFSKAALDFSYSTFEAYNLKLYIWSVYGDYGIKNIDYILDKYFTNIYFYQNNQSLYNFNLVKSEFRSGSEIQAPLNNFDSISIDTEYRQPLYGPYRTTNNFTPSSALGAGGVQRLNALCGDSKSCPPVNISIEEETSDDIRYIRTWPLEYDCKGNPFVISNARVNYTQFDKTSSTRSSQEAVPITHYIANENVEEVYVTIGIDQLFDTNHIDMVSLSNTICGTKALTSADVMDGIGTYAQLPGNYILAGSETFKMYFLVFGNTKYDAMVLDANKSLANILDNLKSLDPVESVKNLTASYYNPPSVFTSNFKTTKNTYYLFNLDNVSAPKSRNYDIYPYTLPNPYKDFTFNFNLKDYFDAKKLEAKLKNTESDNSPTFCFNLNPNEVVANNSNYLIEQTGPDNAYLARINTPYSTNGARFFILSVDFLAPKRDQLLSRSTVAADIRHLIPWFSTNSGIFNVTVNPDSTRKLSFQSTFDFKKYPYIKKYLADNVSMTVNRTQAQLDQALNNIPLLILGLQYNYIASKTSWFISGQTKLTLDALENLINLYAIKNNANTINLIAKILDRGSISVYENVLSKFENNRLLGQSSIYDLETIKLDSGLISSYVTSLANKTSVQQSVLKDINNPFLGAGVVFEYNPNNVFLYDKNAIASTRLVNYLYDYLVRYNLYANNTININSPLAFTPTYQKITRSDDGQINTVAGCDFSAVKQQITAGTKLPANVSVKIETGYENCFSIQPGEYYSYKYDIFGIGAQSFVDLGRKCYPYVYSQQIDTRRNLGGANRLDIAMKFWVIFNSLTKTGSLIFVPPTAQNFYSEFGCSCINEINMGQLFLGYDSKFDIVTSTTTTQGGYIDAYYDDYGNYYEGYYAADETTENFLDLPPKKDVYIKNYGDLFAANQTLIAGNWRFIPGLNYITAGTDWYNLGPGLIQGRAGDGSTYHSPYLFDTSHLTNCTGIKNFDFSSLGSTKTFDAGQLIFTNTTDPDLYFIENQFKAKGFLPLTVSLQDYNQKPKQDCNLTAVYDGGSVVANAVNIKYYEIEASNVKDSNVYYASSSDLIQLPPPKKDTRGESIRRYVKVTKMSHESLSSLIQKSINLNKITEIIPQRFSYPFSAIVGTKIDSRSFAQIPNRTFDAKLKKVLVPSNYFPIDEMGRDIRYIVTPANANIKIYEGDWDGTFKLAWTNNPAWILMDLLINKRYGLGSYIESSQVDIWELYKIARWCDKVDDTGVYYGVPDTYGGVEPRFTFNALIKDKFNLFDMINQVASVFRGSVYYMNSLITFDVDRTKPPIGEFTNNDVKDGIFNYTNYKKDEEFTVVDISYIDARDNFKPKIEYVEDSDGIRQKGILKKTLNSLGTTSRGQARRIGKHFLYQVGKETSNVSFSTDLKALLYKPGDLIYVNDEMYNANKNFGYVKSVENVDNVSFKVVIDTLLNTGIYNKNEISLYTPIAKPKYEDMKNYARKVPRNFSINKDFLKLFSRKGGSLNTYAVFGNDAQLYDYSKYANNSAINFGAQGNFIYSDVEYSIVPNYTVGSSVGSYTIKAAFKYYPANGNTYTPLKDSADTHVKEYSDIYLSYIPNRDIYNNYSSDGVWHLSNAFVSVKLDTSDRSLESSMANKPYFFENFNIGVFCLTQFVGNFVTSDYSQPIYFNATNNALVFNGGYSLANFNILTSFENTIAYTDLVESDRPSIDTFFITGFSTGSYNQSGVYNEYSELFLFKSGKQILPDSEFGFFGPENSNFNYPHTYSKCKTMFLDPSLEMKIPVGSTYSLNLLNKKDRIFKINSIQEIYINEYNITAVEYNPNKFKEIEEGAYVDSLENTFNYLHAYNTSSQITKANYLSTPIIKDITVYYSISQYASDSISIEWLPVLNAKKYNIYIKTPSKQTENILVTVSDTDINQETKTFIYNLSMATLTEQGSYTFSVEAYAPFINAAPSVAGNLYSFSPKAKRTISYLKY